MTSYPNILVSCNCLLALPTLPIPANTRRQSKDIQRNNERSKLKFSQKKNRMEINIDKKKIANRTILTCLLYANRKYMFSVS